MEQTGALEVDIDRLARKKRLRERDEATAYVEGDDDAGGVVVGQLDGGAEVSMVVRRLGYEPGAGAAIEFQADGAAAGRPDKVVAAEQRHVPGLERHRRRVQRRRRRRPADHHHQRSKQQTRSTSFHGCYLPLPAVPTGACVAVCRSSGLLTPYICAVRRHV